MNLKTIIFIFSVIFVASCTQKGGFICDQHHGQVRERYVRYPELNREVPADSVWYTHDSASGTCIENTQYTIVWYIDKAGDTFQVMENLELEPMSEVRASAEAIKK